MHDRDPGGHLDTPHEQAEYVILRIPRSGSRGCPSGSATVLGFDVATQSLQIRQRVGYLAQLPRFYDDLTPRQTLRFARGFCPPTVDVEDDLTEAIELVILEETVPRPGGSATPACDPTHRSWRRRRPHGVLAVSGSFHPHASVAEPADALGLGPSGPHGPWGFESPRSHKR